MESSPASVTPSECWTAVTADPLAPTAQKSSTNAATISVLRATGPLLPSLGRLLHSLNLPMIKQALRARSLSRTRQYAAAAFKGKERANVAYKGRLERTRDPKRHSPCLLPAVAPTSTVSIGRCLRFGIHIRRDVIGRWDRRARRPRLDSASDGAAANRVRCSIMAQKE